MPEPYVDYHKGRVPVNLPRDLKVSDVDRGIESSTAVIITVTADGRMYLGKTTPQLKFATLAPR